MDEIIRELMRQAFLDGDLNALQKLLNELVRNGRSGEVIKIIRDFLKQFPEKASGVREVARSLPPRIARKADALARLVERVERLIPKVRLGPSRGISGAWNFVRKTAYRLVGGMIRLGAAVVSRAIVFGPIGVAVAVAVLVIAIAVALHLLLGNTSTIFVPGKYAGRVVIDHLHACEEFGWDRINRPPGRSKADAFLTVSPQGTVLTIQYPPDGSNTKADNWFETKAGTLVLTSGRMIGGTRHRTGYYFDVTFTYDSAWKQYVGTGTWIIQGDCEAQAPGYPVTITLTPR